MGGVEATEAASSETAGNADVDVTWGRADTSPLSRLAADSLVTVRCCSFCA